MRGSEVQVISGSAGKPSADGRGLVGGIVVQHHVHLASRWQVGIQMVEKFLELARTMTSKTFSDYITGGYVQGRKQGRSPMPLVIVTPALGLSVASARPVGCDSTPEFGFFRPHKVPARDLVGSCTALRCRAPSPPARDRWRAERSGCDGAAVRRPSKCD